MVNIGATNRSPLQLQAPGLEADPEPEVAGDGDGGTIAFLGQGDIRLSVGV